VVEKNRNNLKNKQQINRRLLKKYLIDAHQYSLVQKHSQAPPVRAEHTFFD